MVIKIKKKTGEWWLRECPKCGGKQVEFRDTLDAPEAWIECLSCGHSTGMYSDTKNAVSEWNGTLQDNGVKVVEGDDKWASIHTDPVDMMAYVTIAPDMLNDLLVYAERYAMGRRTYAVADVCRAIKVYKGCLREKTKRVIIKEIIEGIGSYADGKFGADEDAKKWNEVLRELEETIDDGSRF